ncbi:MAG TPA: DUF4837 family protein [Caldithrix abyssi]|uniref:DUF4837 family protein n=1 Tax=Caldithrix abyssi TaxID=187145 RepID=A0A7V5PMU2_CALAY|nr:DUF4837 family protein [Caldithrix abyssi]
MRLKRLINHLTVLLAGILMLQFSGCDLRPTVMGYQHRIFVVADSTLWASIGKQVTDAFEHIIYTPHTETTFNVTPISLDKLNEFKTRMNVFLIGVEKPESEMTKYLEKSLPETFKKGVDSGEYFYMFASDMYAKGQINLIMFAPDEAAFLKNLDKFKDVVYRTFEKKYYARLKKDMFEKGEQTDLEDYLAEHFGWKVRMQHDYFIAIQDVDNKYVWLRRMYPDRWLSVWETPEDSSVFNLKGLVKIRNAMTRKYYEGDYVVDEDLQIDTVDFNGQRALKMQGVWRNDSLLVGGPFHMYALVDPLKSRTFFIDLAVMAPGKFKKPYLDQLEVIAHTFEIVDKK